MPEIINELFQQIDALSAWVIIGFFAMIFIVAEILDEYTKEQKCNKHGD
jgi:hypothetical protein